MKRTFTYIIVLFYFEFIHISYIKIYKVKRKMTKSEFLFLFLLFLEQALEWEIHGDGNFGISVDLHQERIVVGTNLGLVYVYQKSNISALGF